MFPKKCHAWHVRSRRCKLPHQNVIAVQVELQDECQTAIQYAHLLEQFRLLERGLDRVVVYSDGKHATVGSVPNVRKTYAGLEANNLRAANFPTALSTDASREFTEKESLDMMLELDTKIASSGVRIPDSNNSEYADFAREAVANNYLTAEQANRLADTAEINMRTRFRRLLGIPLFPIPGTHTTDGRTVEVRQK